MVNETNDVDVTQNDKLTNAEVHNEAWHDQEKNLRTNPKDNDYFSNTQAQGSDKTHYQYAFEYFIPAEEAYQA